VSSTSITTTNIVVLVLILLRAALGEQQHEELERAPERTRAHVTCNTMNVYACVCACVCVKSCAKRSILLTLAEHREMLFAEVSIYFSAVTLAPKTLKALSEDYPPSYLTQSLSVIKGCQAQRSLVPKHPSSSGVSSCKTGPVWARLLFR